MASGEATEPLQYTTTVLRVSIHCEGCKKKVKKVLQSIEGVYKVTIDAMQHRVTVTGSVGADALIRRLHKSGKQAALWPAPPAAAAEAKKPKDTVAAAPSDGKSGKGADKAEAKPKEVEPQNSEEKPEKEKGSEKKPEKEKGAENKPEKAKAEAKKPKDEAAKEGGEVSEKMEKEKGSPEPAGGEEAAGEETGGKKGKKKKNKQQKDAVEGDAAVEKPLQPQPQQAMPMPAPALGPPDRALGGFPYYPAPQPVMSYNVAHPSASVSYYAPAPVMSMQPMAPPQIPYGYSPYPPMMMPPPPPEFLYGPPGMRSSPPRESYNMFNEENPNSCSLM